VIREVSLERPYRSEGLRSAIDALIIEVSRFLASGKATGSSRLPIHPAVEQARQILDLHLAQPWTLRDLGRLTGVSPNHLVLLFSAALGVSPHQYLLRLRLERAKDLLRNSEAAITQIALELGFGSSQHFANAFKLAMGCHASLYRKNSRLL
jgi:transcriptional regulator GlxA family with amidase domain